MAELIDGNLLKRRIIKDIRVDLTEEFDKNFERKAFFTKAWKKRKDPNANGSLLNVSGTLRRSIRESSEETDSGVRFSSSVPYATVHNEGANSYATVREHQRKHYKSGKVYTVHSYQRRVNIPQRQFVGDGQRTQEIIRGVIEKNLKDFGLSLTKFIKTNNQ